MGIEWKKISETLPKTAAQLVRDIQRAYESGGDDPARAVDMTLLEKLSGVRARFEALKKEGAK
ncbi:MAG TPA: hypothetical protein VEI50_01720 [Nitrospiraceae bacterium]|nr:hypothetical protein [Nitrospiraceae bacterium]